ncbi:MAG: periplasmic heavy metal sensor [Caulobacteraceae bacterium]
MTARWTSIALIASAALNLFLIATGVTLLALGADQARHHVSGRPSLRAAALSLAPAQRTAFLALLQTEGQSVHDANARARAVRAAAWGSLAEPSFDPAAAEAALARARALNETSRAKVEDGVLGFAAALPPDQRARFGEAMRRPPAKEAPHPSSPP